MLSLQGRLSSNSLAIVRDKTKLLFAEYDKFKTPEAVVVYEQSLLTDEELLQACCEEYHKPLSTPRREYIPRDLVEQFRDTNSVPIKYTAVNNTVTVGVLPELPGLFHKISNIGIQEVMVPIHYYVDIHMAYYGRPNFMLPLPTKDYLDFIYTEALALRASDITIYNSDKYEASVIYNVRKRLVHSKRRILGEQVLEIAQTLATSGHATFDASNEDPRFFSIRVDMHNRGRVVVNKTYYGWCITIRILPDDYLTTTLEDLNIKPNAHNHIIFCAADNINHVKYHDCKKSYYNIRSLSDDLCREHKLSIITPGEKRGKTYREWQARKNGSAWKEQLKSDIDEAIKNAATYEDCIELIRAKGYEIKVEYGEKTENHGK